MDATGFIYMNYDSIKTRLEKAHSILIQTGEELDLYDLGFFPAAIKKKDWRGALSCLEECGVSANCDSEFWIELLDAAKELELPRYVTRIQKRIHLEAI
jgi:hypothetical protein